MATSSSNSTTIGLLMAGLAVTACGPAPSETSPPIPIVEDLIPTFTPTPLAAPEQETTDDGGLSDHSTAVPATFTPTPIGQPQEQSQPPSPPASPTPTVTLIPTSAPPATPVSGDAARGTIAVSRSVRLSEDPSPAGIGCHIFTVNPDGSNSVDLTPDSQACALDPSYSPDGLLIAYVEKRGRGTGGNSIVVMTANGARNLSVSDQTYFQTGGPLIWTHDGSQIAIYFPGDFSWHVHNVADGREVETVSDLTSDRWRLPGVSPDGQIEAAYCPATDTERYAALCLTTSATGKTVRLTESLGVYGRAISWSPDGVWLAFDGLDPNSQSYGTYVMRGDGTGLQFIGEGSSPSWRPG